MPTTILPCLLLLTHFCFRNAHFQYAKFLYTFYQAKIASIAEPDIVKVCKSLRRLSFAGKSPTESETDSSSQSLAVGTSLFELYLIIQKFVALGNDLCPIDCDTFEIRNFHKWFHGGVSQWLDIAVFKALRRIEKAVEVDNLEPVDAAVKYSSSAVDTCTIFYQIKVFWEQLNWPDIEGCYTFIAKIIDVITNLNFILNMLIEKFIFRTFVAAVFFMQIKQLYGLMVWATSRTFTKKDFKLPKSGVSL